MGPLGEFAGPVKLQRPGAGDSLFDFKAERRGLVRHWTRQAAE